MFQSLILMTLMIPMIHKTQMILIALQHVENTAIVQIANQLSV